MTKITIEVPDDIAQRVADAAAQQGLAPEQLAGQVVTDSFTPRRKLSFIGIGQSGQRDAEAIAERHKKVRREHFSDQTAADV